MFRGTDDRAVAFDLVMARSSMRSDPAVPVRSTVGESAAIDHERTVRHAFPQ
jgi:hypothetical protein